MSAVTADDGTVVTYGSETGAAAGASSSLQMHTEAKKEGHIKESGKGNIDTLPLSLSLLLSDFLSLSLSQLELYLCLSF